MRRRFAIALSLAVVSTTGLLPRPVYRDNPIIQTKYTADPAPMVYDGKVFLYTSHDEDTAVNFVMYNWMLYTSSDMANWTDHGIVAGVKAAAARAMQVAQAGFPAPGAKVEVRLAAAAAVLLTRAPATPKERTHHETARAEQRALARAARRREAAPARVRGGLGLAPTGGGAGDALGGAAGANNEPSSGCSCATGRTSRKGEVSLLLICLGSLTWALGRRRRAS